MATTELTDLKAFYDFLRRKVEAKENITPEQAIAEWQEYLEVVESIRRGLADIDAGKTLPAEVALRQLREEFGI